MKFLFYVLNFICMYLTISASVNSNVPFIKYYKNIKLYCEIAQGHFWSLNYFYFSRKFEELSSMVYDLLIFVSQVK